MNRRHFLALAAFGAISRFALADDLPPDITITRNAQDRRYLDIAVGGSLVVHTPLATVAKITLAGGPGNERLTVDVTNGLINVLQGIHFDGGTGVNTLTISGDTVLTNIVRKRTGNVLTEARHSNGSLRLIHNARWPTGESR